MKSILSILSFLFILCITSSNALAVTSTAIVCDAPTTRTDGATLTKAEIQGYWLYYQVNGAYSEANKRDITCDGTPQAISSLNLPDGTYKTAIKVYDTGDRVSGYSVQRTAVVEKFITVANPNVPKFLSIN